MEYLGINIDLKKDENYDLIGLQRLKDSYMLDEETSPQQRLAFVSKQFSSNPEHAQRMYNYASDFWFGYATPIQSFGRNKSGLPISCFLNFVSDTKRGLVDNLSETNWLSMLGGGVGTYWSIRGSDEKSVGVIPHMKVYDDSSLAFRQGTTRRGSYAEYIDISHPDIIEFIEMRKETGDPRRKCLNLHHGVNIPDSFMKIIENCMLDNDFDDSWELKDPVTGKVHEVVSAKELWEKLLEYRAGQGRGEPYIHYIDNTNNTIPEYLKNQGYEVRQSNLCLTGDTLIDIKVNDQISKISLEEFTIKFTLGAFNGAVYVKSYNVKEDRVVWSEVSVAAKTAEVDELYEIETPSGKIIKCTADHQIWTVNRGYVRAKDLNETDTLLEN